LHALLLVGCAASSAYAEPISGNAVASAPGRIEGASDVISIGTAASGIVEELRVTVGDLVTKGQVLAQISCNVVQVEVRQREAEAMMADAVLSRIKTGARDEEIAIAAAAVQLAEARAEEALRTQQRLSSVDGVATRARIGESERDSKMAAALLLDARMRLRMLQAGARGEEVIEAEARRAAAAAALEYAQAKLAQCSVRAPVDGMVLTTSAAPGQFVEAAAATPLLKMVDSRVLRVRAEVDERDLQKVCLGQHAEVTSEAFKGLTLSAHVTQMTPGMGRRTMAPGDRIQKGDEDVRQVMLTLTPHEMRWPVGLRVLVHFQKC
jgi:multidrug resistance efflux pump